MRLRICAAALVPVAFGLTLGGASPALAVERQHHLGGGVSLAILKVQDKSTLDVGGSLALHYTYGINDQFNFMAELATGIVARDQKQDDPTSPRTRPAGVDHATVGGAYVLDVLRWVPYGCLLVGMYHLSGGTLPHALLLPGVEAGIGLDYQLSRSWAVGVALREHLLLTKLGTYPTYSTGTLRLEYMWGF